MTLFGGADKVRNVDGIDNSSKNKDRYTNTPLCVRGKIEKRQAA